MKATCISVILLLLMAVSPAIAQANGVPGGNPDRSMDEVRDEITNLKEVIMESYEELLEDAPDASGTIDVTFLITPQGAVDDVKVSCDEGLETLEEAVLAGVEDLDFGPCPGQNEDIPVTVPFELLPCQED